MTRYRVAFVTVMGQQWYDVTSRDAALAQARAEKRAGAIQVEVMEERPWPPGQEHYANYAANFVRIWP